MNSLTKISITRLNETNNDFCKRNVGNKELNRCEDIKKYIRGNNIRQQCETSCK